MNTEEINRLVDTLLIRLNEIYEEVINLGIIKKNSYYEFVDICRELYLLEELSIDTRIRIWKSDYGSIGAFIKIMELEKAFYEHSHKINYIPRLLVYKYSRKIKDVAEDIIMSYKEEYSPIPNFHDWCRRILKYLDKIERSIELLEKMDDKIFEKIIINHNTNDPKYRRFMRSHFRLKLPDNKNILKN